MPVKTLADLKEEYNGILAGVIDGDENKIGDRIHSLEGVSDVQIILDIPEEIGHYSHDIQHFVTYMIHKLWVHRKKGHWKDVDINDVMEKLRGEITELQSVLSCPTPDHEMEKRRYAQECHKEAADVANYALIISSSVRRNMTDKQYEMKLDEPTAKV